MSTSVDVTKRYDFPNRPDDIMAQTVDSEDERARALEQQQISKHYEIPNLTSVLYDFTGREMERIKNSFRIGNFHSLRDLPNNLSSGHVNLLSRSKIEDNLYGHKEERSYIELQKGGGFFSKFEWMEDPYERFLDQKTLERVSHQHDVEGAGHSSEFVTHPKCEVRHAHQFQFQSLIPGPNASLFAPISATISQDPSATNQAIGYLMEGDPYEASSFEVLRAKWIEDSKKIYGDFSTTMGQRDLNRVNRAHLPEAVAYMKRRLLADWSDINFIIGTNPEDYIELRFLVSEEAGDALAGLHAYMNCFIKSDEKLSKFMLRRVTEYWGLKTVAQKENESDSADKHRKNNEDEESQQQQGDYYVYYMLGPPWARQAKPVLYLQQLNQD